MDSRPHMHQLQLDLQALNGSVHKALILSKATQDGDTGFIFYYETLLRFRLQASCKRDNLLPFIP